MANEPEVLEKGLYIDGEGNLVHDVPEAGIQIVPPGGVLDDNGRARLKAEFGLDGNAVDAFVTSSTSSEDAKPKAKTKAAAAADAEADAPKDSK